MIGLTIIVLVCVIVALLAPWLAPHDPNEQALDFHSAAAGLAARRRGRRFRSAPTGSAAACCRG